MTQRNILLTNDVREHMAEHVTKDGIVKHNTEGDVAKQDT